MPQATIAVIEGVCRGGGSELAMAFDMRYAALGQGALRPTRGGGRDHPWRRRHATAPPAGRPGARAGSHPRRHGRRRRDRREPGATSTARCPPTSCASSSTSWPPASRRLRVEAIARAKRAVDAALGDVDGRAAHRGSAVPGSPGAAGGRADGCRRSSTPAPRPASSSSATTRAVRRFRTTQPRTSESPSALTLTGTMSPSCTSPASSILASWSPMACWISRRSGRAP